MAVWRPEYLWPGARAFIDCDPGFTQISIEQGHADLSETVGRSEHLFTFAQRTDGEDGLFPKGDREWRSTVPPVAPKARTARMLLASATLPLTPTVTRDRKRIAVLTKVAAGRACSATAWGRVTWTSELACTTSLLGRSRHVFESLSRRRNHRRRDGTLDKRRVDQPDMAVAAALFQEVADREDRAAEVREHDDALSGVSPVDRAPDSAVGGPQRPVRASARRLHSDLVPGQLRRQRGQPVSELKAVGDQYNPDQFNLR